MNITGSREGFVEPIRVNQTMIRRRLRSPSLKFEMYPIGEKSRTDICLVYLTDTADPRMVEEVKRRLGKLSSDILLSQGYLRPYLEGQPLSPFSSVGTTERPDTLCAKINEGRIGILVDGTPFALVVPYLFEEHFQSMDDYSYRPYYGSFIRLLKYFAFLLSIFLPGGYVAITSFSPEMLPDSLLFNIAASEQQTPFSMMTEALVIHLIYEIMREAGLRLPRPVGHAVQHHRCAGHRGCCGQSGNHRLVDGDGGCADRIELLCCSVAVRTGSDTEICFYPGGRHLGTVWHFGGLCAAADQPLRTGVPRGSGHGAFESLCACGPAGRAVAHRLEKAGQLPPADSGFAGQRLETARAGRKRG